MNPHVRQLVGGLGSRSVDLVGRSVIMKAGNYTSNASIGALISTKRVTDARDLVLYAK